MLLKEIGNMDISGAMHNYLTNSAKIYVNQAISSDFIEEFSVC